ncbi:dTMP kinase [Paracoccus marinaquae]|uniref:Thymidylate kinase n=1 Tax=Paracoccus marinaquae TaxID=2841926 RepID=A0ABS6AHU2_9RHOB|nr:dTMP kinase [Paracoccus marinaquae]MBU3030166.1 dTMP kinase [Paracoccus marinaquae]
MFLSFEGIDGCGKSTQARLLAEALRAEGREVVLTREPGGSPGAEEIRRLLVEGHGERWSAETECLLFTAARRDHLERTIRPALAAGRTVITDRFADSTRVYQGAARGELRGIVDRLHALMIGVEPDRSFVIDIAPEDALRRAAKRQAAVLAAKAATATTPLEAARTAATAQALMAEDRFESLGLDFQQKLAAGFRALAREYPDRVRLIDGSGTPEDVAARVRAAL